MIFGRGRRRLLRGFFILENAAMPILNVSGLTKYYGAEFIFGDITFQVARDLFN